MFDRLDYLVSMGMTILLMELKDGAKEKYRKITLKICKTAGITFAGDPEFVALWKSLAGSSELE